MQPMSLRENFTVVPNKVNSPIYPNAPLILFFGSENNKLILKFYEISFKENTKKSWKFFIFCYS